MDGGIADFVCRFGLEFPGFSKRSDVQFVVSGIKRKLRNHLRCFLSSKGLHFTWNMKREKFGLVPMRCLSIFVHIQLLLCQYVTTRVAKFTCRMGYPIYCDGGYDVFFFIIIKKKVQQAIKYVMLLLNYFTLTGGCPKVFCWTSWLDFNWSARILTLNEILLFSIFYWCIYYLDFHTCYFNMNGIVNLTGYSVFCIESHTLLQVIVFVREFINLTAFFLSWIFVYIIKLTYNLKTGQIIIYV